MKRKNRKKKKLGRTFLKVQLVTRVVLAFLCVQIIGFWILFLKYYFMLSPIFSLKKVLILGNMRTPSYTIIALSGLYTGKNIFLINKEKVISSICKDRFIKDVKIEIFPPHTVGLTVFEKEIFALYLKDGNFFYVDDKGDIIYKVRYRQKLDYPVLCCDTVYLPELVSILKSINSRLLPLSSISQALYLKDERVVIYTNDKTSLIIDGRDYRRSLTHLEKICKKFGLSVRAFESIDLSYKKFAFARLKPIYKVSFYIDKSGGRHEG